MLTPSAVPPSPTTASAPITGACDGTLGLNSGVIGERLADLGEQRLALMDETGVDIQFLSLTTPGLNNLGRHGIDLACRANDLLNNAVAANPSRFQATAALPAAEADAAAGRVAAIRRATRLQGCGSFRAGRRQKSGSSELRADICLCG